MSALTPAHADSRVSAVAILAARLARLRHQVIAAWRRRTEVAVLASFDDFMLRDIGLSRGDVNDALAEPLWRDPTAVLLRRQRRRRHGANPAIAVIRLPARKAPSLVPDTEVSPPGDRRLIA